MSNACDSIFVVCVRIGSVSRPYCPIPNWPTCFLLGTTYAPPTIGLCTIGLATSNLHNLRRTAFAHWPSGVLPTLTPSEPMVGSLIVWPGWKPLLKNSTERPGQSSPEQRTRSRASLRLSLGCQRKGDRSRQITPLAPWGLVYRAWLGRPASKPHVDPPPNAIPPSLTNLRPTSSQPFVDHSAAVI